jgi:hypothetical protein
MAKYRCRENKPQPLESTVEPTISPPTHHTHAAPFQHLGLELDEEYTVDYYIPNPEHDHDHDRGWRVLPGKHRNHLPVASSTGTPL